MKNIVRLLFFITVIFNLSYAQKAKIYTEALTPHRLTALGFTTNSVSSGLNVVPNQTYVYLSARNIGNDEPINSATFTLTSQPATSTASLEVLTDPTWVQFKPDIVGTYTVQLSITTASGTHDTTANVYAANYVGVGNFEGVAGSFPKCMTCHSGTQKFADIFNTWKVSGHANVFNQQIEISDHYSTSCMTCHTTGYDHNLVAANNGFDDVAATLGWSYIAPSNDQKWDSLKTGFAGLVNLATIGCESCHGPGSEHASTTDVNKIQISLEAGNCAQCHDEPWRHNKYSEYENSKHSEVIWSSSFAQGTSSQNNSLGNCIRCHDGQGFVNYTKGQTTNTTGMVMAQLQNVTCAACHDPHGNSNEFSLRDVPAGSDTLGNGYVHTQGGLGQICMNCHKARQNNVTYVTTNLSSRWGPHHSVQTDVFLGKNAAEFGSPFVSGSHNYAVTNACVDCHMVATTDTGQVTRDRVGGHSFNLHDADNNYYHTTSCTNCHGPINNWDDFMAVADHDGDGTVESIPQEIAGLERLLRIWLPPVGVDSIAWNLIDNNNINQKKAYWNYQLIANDGSGGMHNAKFAIDVLTKSILAIGGVVPVELTSFEASVKEKDVTLTWTTATETNNRGFDIEKKSGQNWKSIGFAEGKGTTTEKTNYSYTDKNNENSGTVYYRLKQIDFDGTFSYSKEISAELNSVPNSYSLDQNYPNPFNPTTTIKFNLPFDSNVKVVVFNITGEVLSTLVNSQMAAGSHKVEFNSKSFGADLSSGIYFFSFEANAVDGSSSFRQTKKMILLK